jgi:integrase
MVGAPPSWLARQMGHRDWSMISKIYGKWIPNEGPDLINTLAKKLGQIK